MSMKTLTGPTIQAALAEARRLLGDDVLLLESYPAAGDLPARVTVMADSVAKKPVYVPPVAVAEESFSGGVGFGYGALERLRKAAQDAEEKTGRHEGFSAGSDGYERPVESQPVIVRQPPRNGYNPRGVEPKGMFREERSLSQKQPPRRREGVGRGQLFPAQTNFVAPANPPVAETQIFEQYIQQLEAQFTLVHERLAAMEQRFNNAMVGASLQWTTHPIFVELVRKGVQPGTVTKLFNGLVEHGFQLDADEESLRWALAQQMRRMLDMTAPRQVNGTQVFIGPSGAGKTSLLLKLATHSGFFARRNTTVIAILPEDDDTALLHDPMDLFKRFGLPFQAVRTPEEMAQALHRVQHFDQILIDTPAIPVREAPARRELLRLKRILDPIVPMQVHLVLNATRVLEGMDASYIQRLPVRPDTLALTHLDETEQLGRLAEWMMRLKLPVLFTSTGRRVPDDAFAFTTSRFVEELLDLH